MEDIWEGVNKARLILGDLTSKNPNVTYEVGVADVLGKDVVLLSPPDGTHVAYTAGQGADTVGRQIGLGIDGQHAWRRARRLGIDFSQICVRVGRAQDVGMRLAGEVDVVRIAAVAGEEARVFGTRHRLADSKLSHEGFLDRLLA